MNAILIPNETKDGFPIVLETSAISPAMTNVLNRVTQTIRRFQTK